MIIDKTFQEILDYAMVTILGFSEQGDMLFANQEAKNELGYSEGFDGISLREILHKWDFTDEMLSDFINQNVDTVINVTVYRKNQTCFPAEVKMGKISIGPQATILCSVNNTFKQKEAQKRLEWAEEEIKKAREARNVFVANVTHELRTPVNGILGHARYILDNGILTTEQRREVKIMERCCFNMEKIINNILDFSKIEAGKFTLEEVEFDFRECLQQVWETNIVAANEKGIKFTVQISDTIPKTVIGDELRLGQILNNLVANAIKFTSVGFVRIEAIPVLQFSNEIEIFIMVIDSGIGIAEQEKEHVFESFQQADGSITRRYGGTGLGLAVCKELVEMMNGKISLESEVNRGSTFSFSVVLHTTKETPKSKEIRNKPQIVSRQIDDDVSLVYQFGTEANIRELRNNLDKMIICIEMENWEKAEQFADTVKLLLANADEDIKKTGFRMEMAVRKEDYDKSNELFHKIKVMLGEE